MQRVPVVIAAAQLTTSAAAYYTVPGGGTVATINNLSLTNTTDTAATVTLHRVPSGGSPTPANMIASAYSIPAGKSYVPPQVLGMHMSTGMTLQALSGTAAAITIAGGAYETSGS